MLLIDGYSFNQLISTAGHQPFTFGYDAAGNTTGLVASLTTTISAGALVPASKLPVFTTRSA